MGHAPYSCKGVRNMIAVMCPRRSVMKGRGMSEHDEGSVDQRRVADAARVIRENRTGLVLTGRIKNGKLELDQSTLDEIEEKFPQADVSFIALNSPFDATSVAL